MKNTLGLLVAITMGSWLSHGRADGPSARCPGCQSGCRHSSAGHECVRVPSHKTVKKVVYDVKCVPVCVHRPANFFAGCDCCPVCELKYKKVLLKREIVVCETCTTTCVPVEVAPGACPAGHGKTPGASIQVYAEPLLPPPAQVTIAP